MFSTDNGIDILAFELVAPSPDVTDSRPGDALKFERMRGRRCCQDVVSHDDMGGQVKVLWRERVGSHEVGDVSFAVFGQRSRLDLP